VEQLQVLVVYVFLTEGSKKVEQLQELVVYVFPMESSKKMDSLMQREESVPSGWRNKFGKAD
jgi:hypothetical protein